MTSEVIIAIIGSGALASLVSVVGTIITKRLDRSDALRAGVRLGLYYHLTERGMRYVNAGYVDPDDLKCLYETYAAYKELGGDGFCDKVMADVQKLPLKEGRL